VAPWAYTRKMGWISGRRWPFHTQPVSLPTTARPPVQCVLRELDFMWRPGGPPEPSRPLGTFESVIQEVGAAAWKGLPIPQRAQRLSQWLVGVVGELREPRQKLRWRFRRAWEVAPALMLGRDLDEATLVAAAKLFDRDQRRVEVIAEQYPRSTPSAQRSMRSELGATIERYAHPPDGATQWAYLVEAIRVAVEFLPFIELTQMRRPDSDRSGELPVPDPTATECFALAVYDAMCPGRAHSLDLRDVREALVHWKGMKRPRRGRRGSTQPRKARRETFWLLIRRMTRPPGSAETLARRWPKIRGSIALKRTGLIAGLLERREVGVEEVSVFVPRTGGPRLLFAPPGPGHTQWVEYLLYAVRDSLPPNALPASKLATGTDWAPPLPEAFLGAAETILPPVKRGLRGPPPMSNRDALPWIIHKFRRDIGWKYEGMPSGTKYQKRFSSWSADTRSALAGLAQAHGALGESGVEAMRRG
jgi:hypothetical protein